MNWPHGKAGRKAVRKRYWPTVFSEGCSVPWQVEKHPDLVQTISAAVGSAVGAVTGESSIGSNVSLGGTKWNDEAFDLNSKEIAFITFLLGLTQQDNLIINASNEVIAEWTNGFGWLSQTGEKIGDTAQ